MTCFSWTRLIANVFESSALRTSQTRPFRKSRRRRHVPTRRVLPFHAEQESDGYDSYGFVRITRSSSIVSNVLRLSFFTFSSSNKTKTFHRHDLHLYRRRTIVVLDRSALEKNVACRKTRGFVALEKRSLDFRLVSCVSFDRTKVQVARFARTNASARIEDPFGKDVVFSTQVKKKSIARVPRSELVFVEKKEGSIFERRCARLAFKQRVRSYVAFDVYQNLERDGGSWNLWMKR